MSSNGDSGGGPHTLTPDFTSLVDVAKDFGDEMVLEIIGRVGAKPYLRWTGDEWEGLTIGPWDSTDDGTTIICAKEMEDVDEEFVYDLVDSGPIVQLVWFSNTPFDGYESWEYTGLDTEGEL